MGRCLGRQLLQCTSHDLHRLSEDSSDLIFTQFLHNVVSTAVFFYKTSCWCNACSLVFFLSLSFYPSNTLDCSSCEYENAGHGQRKRTLCCEPRLNWVRAYTQLSQPRRIAHRLGLTEEPHTDRPSKWHSIARHVPGRTNKDCRKRWCATMASIVSKGGWSSEEDRKLLDAVKKHGMKCVASPSLFCRGTDYRRHFRWSVVASLVETRNSGRKSSDHMLRSKGANVDPCRMRKAVARHVEPGYRQEVSATSRKSRTCAYFTSTSAWSAEEVRSNVSLE